MPASSDIAASTSTTEQRLAVRPEVGTVDDTRAERYGADETGTMFTLGLDLDGVCGDYSAEFRHYAARSLGVPEGSLPPHTDWRFSDWGFNEAKPFRAVHAEAVKAGLFRSMPAIAGAAAATKTLSDHGVYIRIITHRLVSEGDHGVAVVDTARWLDHVNIRYADLCFVTDKTGVDADVYLDDGPHNVTALRGAGKQAIIFDAPYNRDVSGTRVRDWSQATELILALKSAADRAA